ncbi:MAG: ATP-dependent DNA helicase RecG [Acidimicrobiales bacterium]|nr:MAG: ATP-dependent DNA helicase RecG [Acidimicrobiales bacterium]
MRSGVVGTRGRRLVDLAKIPVERVPGVGRQNAKALARLDIHTVLDLVTTYPRRYLDRRRQAKIADLAIGEEATILVEVERVSSRQTHRSRPMVTCVVRDDSGRLVITFFNQPWREKQLRPGTTVLVYGRVDVFRGRRQMTNPVVDLIGDRTGRIVPVYPQSDKAGVYTWNLARWTQRALDRIGFLSDPVPAELLGRHGLVDRWTAFRWIHFPEDLDQVKKARDRLVFDELLRVQLALVSRKRSFERRAVGFSHPTDGPRLKRFLERLPWSLTPAQERVLAEIAGDMARPVPMHRLLQGDVGSGKTVIAACTLLMAVDGGRQAALMAPTEVLAEQHHLSLRKLLGVHGRDGGVEPSQPSLFAQSDSDDMGVRVELLTNRVTGRRREMLLEELRNGRVDLVVGTHALIQEGVEFACLGAVVIDEQHRFGVEQRAALRERGDGNPVPDLLVMTATPIPRTAAMTVYGDLDVSILDEMPPGRKPVVTNWARDESRRREAWDQVRAEVRAGRQAYVVCPLIEESERAEVAAAEDVFRRLVEGELSGLRVGLMHGRLPQVEKERSMSLFRDGMLDVLVATTVIEVGVDVPNATVIVILDADRFGLAQLHQLRGRVGRGEHPSTCWLLAEPTTEEGNKRLEAMVRTTDGFELAEVDLELRGEGTIMGGRQTGRSDLRLASLRRDREWVLRARSAAEDMVGDEPGLGAYPELREEVRAMLDPEDTRYLFRS